MAVLAENGLASLPKFDDVSSRLEKESRFFMGIERSEIQSLTDVLEDLNSFLQYADAKSAEKLMRDSVRSWLEQTKDAAEVKGCVEELCLLKLGKILQDSRIIRFLSRAARRFSKLAAIRNEFSEVKKSKELTRNIHENAQKKEDEATSSTAGIAELHNRKLFHSFIGEYADSAAKVLTSWVTDEEPKRSVLSLVGPSGIGKATLARKVYDSEMVRDSFDCCFWVNVSMSYRIPDQLRIMIEKITQETLEDVGVLQDMRTVQLFATMRQSLRTKRYLIVFDDVFHEKFWHVIKNSLPENDRGSRIIIITPSDKVADSCKESSFDQVYTLVPLSYTRSWDLFCRIAFEDEPEMRCPTELEQLSHAIVGTCQGFPLSIVGIAGLLSKKEKLVSEWKMFYANLKLEWETNLQPPGVSEVLALSFRDLPYYLRSCFLYFSIFPQDSVIANEKLFKLWIAEGFVEEKTGKTLEEVAEEYLNELIRRDLVQPCQGFYGLDQFCQVDALIHDVARVKADELNFCQILEDSNSGFQTKSPRLSVRGKSLTMFHRSVDSQVRSIFLFNIDSLHGSFLTNLIWKCELLTLLDLGYHPIANLPEELGNLNQLKYLSLKNTKVSKLPKSVDELENLQTLDLRNTLLLELPTEINKLKNLRHLLASVYDHRTNGESTQGVTLNKGIGRLQNLHTLMTVDADRSGIGIIQELANLKQLRTLCVSGLAAETATVLCTCIDGFSHLESLSCKARNNIDTLNLQSISSRLPFLRRLVLKSLLQSPPDWISGLQNLSTLCLSLSRLTEDPLIHLSHLPNLVSLWLYRAFQGEQLYFEEGGFKNLKLLVIRELHGLNMLEIEDGALPRLEELRIGLSPLLNEVPSGIQYLRNLKVLANYDMGEEFVVSMKPDFGADYWKVKHIPSVIFLYRVQGRNYKQFELGDSDFLDQVLGLAKDGRDVPKRQDEHESSFCESDDDEKEDYVGELSFSANKSTIPWKNTNQWSFSSGFYSDDLEE